MLLHDDRSGCFQKEPCIFLFPSFCFSLFPILLCSFGASRLSWAEDKGKEAESDVWVRSPSADTASGPGMVGSLPGALSVVLPVMFHCWAPQLWCSGWGSVSPRLAAAPPHDPVYQMSTVLTDSCLWHPGLLSNDPSRTIQGISRQALSPPSVASIPPEAARRSFNLP